MQSIKVIQNPYLQDLPFKIERNKWGRIETSLGRFAQRQTNREETTTMKPLE